MEKMKNTGHAKLYFIIFHFSLFIYFVSAKLLHFGKNTKKISIIHFSLFIFHLN